MNRLQGKLEKYIDNPKDALVNLSLAKEYFYINQTGAALTFFLRAAELTTNTSIQYEALLSAAICFDKQGQRDESVIGLLAQAVSLMPTNPIGHFLFARFYEYRKNYVQSYLYSCLGLDLVGLNENDIFTITKPNIEGVNTEIIPYPGEYGLLFQKAVAAWWIGRCNESKEIFYALSKLPELNKEYKASIEKNIKIIGLPNNLTQYKKKFGKYHNFKFPFPKFDSMESNFSQSFQDLFVLAILKESTADTHPGTYLEIGSSDPFIHSNTALLEQFGWSGISVDINPREVANFRNQRTNNCICTDALTIDYTKFIPSVFNTNVIDYLQIDCDPPKNSYLILEKILNTGTIFKVVTFEHDYYYDKEWRDKSRELLLKNGYVLVVGNISFLPDKPYEDWWIHKSIVDDHTSKFMELSPTPEDKNVYCVDYMFNKDI